MVSIGISMIVYVSFDFVHFLGESGMTDATVWKRATSIMYPNVSICNAKYFSNERLRGTYKVTSPVIKEMSLLFLYSGFERGMGNAA